MGKVQAEGEKAPCKLRKRTHSLGRRPGCVGGAARMNIKTRKDLQ